MIFWMARQARSLKRELESDVRRAAAAPGGGALFTLAFIATAREGIELALFLTAATFSSGAGQTLVGALLGLIGSSILAWLLFESTLRLNLRRFFQVTGALLIIFAAGLVAHGVHEFNEIGWIPSLIDHVWDINFFLNETSLLGEFLKTLIGYNANPSLTEVLAYGVYFAAILFGLRRPNTGLPVTQKA
jgi:high-affinity iron transporter